MVKYKVIISDQAKKSLKNIYTYIKEDSSLQAAQKVRDGIKDTIATLASNPEANGPANDLNDETIVYRRILKWSYRIIFRIYEEKLEVLVVEIHNTKQSTATIKKNLGIE